MLRLCSKSSRSYLGRSVRHAPKRVPAEWVVDCTHVGKGITALKYLSRYLYRGVISEKNIVSNQNGQVTFKYIESKTGNTLYRNSVRDLFLSVRVVSRQWLFWDSV